jgi:hypothetical protein
MLPENAPLNSYRIPDGTFAVLVHIQLDMHDISRRLASAHSFRNADGTRIPPGST